MKEKTQSKRVLVFGVVLILIVAVLAGAYFLTRPAAIQGGKTINIVVDTAAGKTETHTLNTDEEYLGPLLANAGIASGENTEFGLFITTVDGIMADAAKEEWWCITKGGEQLMTGANETPIADGETFEITLTTGY